MMEVGPAPPAVGVNVNVADTPDLPVTLSETAILNETKAASPPITPDSTEADSVGSALVCTVTEVFPAVGAPMVRPESVTVTAVLAASAVPPAIMMMDVAPGAPGARYAPIAERYAVGVAMKAKKPEG